MPKPYYVNILEVPRDWSVLREAADEDASPIDLTAEGDYAQKPSSAIQIVHLPSIYYASGYSYYDTDIALAIAAGSAADKTLTWRLFTWSIANGMAQQVAYGTGTTGSQAVVKYPDGTTASNIFWCDTIVVTGYSWPKAVKATPGSGNDSVAMITLDLLNYSYWLVQIEDADGSTGDEAGDVSVWWKGIC